MFMLLPVIDMEVPEFLMPPGKLWLRVMLLMDGDREYAEYLYDTDERERGGVLMFARHEGRAFVFVSERPRCWIEPGDLEDA